MTVQERTAPVCGGCGEVFAHAAFGGAGLFLAETLRDAALAAGWQDDGGWTCTVCQAKANAGPAPEPEPAPAAEPAPDTDPIEQSVTILAEYDDRVDAFWADVNRSNNAAHLRIRTRIGDAYVTTGELTGSGAAA